MEPGNVKRGQNPKTENEAKAKTVKPRSRLRTNVQGRGQDKGQR